tara:strand:- start:339 stop:1682 length:1344 start_codon:yes stop_codon:yes gene_type:complete
VSGIFKDKEGGLEAPTRHPVKWKEQEFLNEDNFLNEAERVFDVCHGCRRCVSLCESFPTLFDLIDQSETFEVDGVDKEDFDKVVDECYMCDLCYQTKCPYVPPHPWAIDFPHLMLRGKSISYENKKKGLLKRLRDKVLTSTDTLGKSVKLPLLDITYKQFSNSKFLRKTTSGLTGIHSEAPLPQYDNSVLKHDPSDDTKPQPAGKTTGKVAIFTGCYCRNNKPSIAEDLIKVLEHNKIAIRLIADEKCCGMPKFDLGDLKSVEQLKEHNLPLLLDQIKESYDIISLVPSCVLMFKQELPLLFSDDQDLLTVKEHIYDPFEYLSLREAEGMLQKDFKLSLGKIAYQAACHQRVQNIGPKTRDVLEMIPETKVETIERCSGHDGTYAIKKETHENSMKIVKPVAKKVDSSGADYLTSDCPLAAQQIEYASKEKPDSAHPISLLRKAYEI